MTHPSDIFETHYHDYCQRLSTVDLAARADRLGLILEDEGARLPFFNHWFHISPDGIVDARGETPGYVDSVILAKYILECPPQVIEDPAWCAFRDFKHRAAMTNANYFNTDTVQKLTTHFSGQLTALESACRELNGEPEPLDAGQDLAVAFDALPRLRLLLLFTDGDDEFPASGRILFQGQAEHYLDPESLAMTSARLIQKLIQCQTREVTP